MIILKAMVAGDKRALTLKLLDNNLTEVPEWISGTSVSVELWTLDIEKSDGTTDTITNLTYPIEYHQSYASSTRITKLKLRRNIGTHELYFELEVGSNSCLDFDFFFVFESRTDESQ